MDENKDVSVKIGGWVTKMAHRAGAGCTGNSVSMYMWAGTRSSVSSPSRQLRE